MEWIKLGDIASVITKGTTPTTLGFEFVDSGINFIKIESISEDGKFINDKFNHITSECDDKLARSRLQKNDVLFSIAGAIGRTAIVTEDILPANTNQALALIRIPEGIINYVYLKYALQSSVVRDQFEKRKQGVAQLNISLKDIANFNIPLPSKAEQQKIVDFIEKVEMLLSLRKQQLAKLDELVKSRFVEMFGDPESNPMGWPIKKLNAVVSSITAGWSANGEARPKKAGEKAVLKVSAVTQGYFKPDEHKVIPADMEIKKYVYPQKGDLLFSRANTRELVGATAIIDQDYPELLLPDKLWKVLFTSEMDVYYAKHILSTQAIRKVFSSQSTGTSGSMYNVSAEKFRDTLIPVPPIGLQHEFADFVQQTDKSKLAIQQSIDQLETLKKSLMQKYFG